MTIFAGQDFAAIYHLGSIPVSYPPKDIRTEAIQVTLANIGALSLEFHASLRYAVDDGMPFFNLDVRRAIDEDPDKSISVHVRVNEWMVVLWDELYIFRDAEFRNTFVLDNLSPKHELSETEQLEQREEDVRRGFVPISGYLESERP
jgi:hypothetical protein